MITSFVYNIFENSNYKSIEDFEKTSVFNEIWFKILVMDGIALIFCFPLNLLKDVSKLRFTTLLAISCIFIVALVIIIQLSDFINEVKVKNPGFSYNIFDISKSFNSDLTIFSAIAKISFSSAPHFGVFNVYDKLTNNDKRRTRKVLWRSSVFNVFFYILVGVTGYLTQPINTPDIIVDRTKLDEPNNQDILMTTVRLLIVIMLLSKLPVIWNALRLSVINLIWNDTEITTKRNLITTIIFTFGTALIGAVYSNIGDFIDLLGGFCSVVISYFFPCFIYIKYKQHSTFHYKNILLSIACGSVVVSGLIACAMIFKRLIVGNKD